METPREVLCWPGLAPGALAEPGVSSQAGADIVLTFLTPAGFTRTNVCAKIKLRALPGALRRTVRLRNWTVDTQGNRRDTWARMGFFSLLRPVEAQWA